jgi:hypothetical protein
MNKAAFGMLIAVATPAVAQQQGACQLFEGARVVTEEGDFLGTIASPYASDSIFNQYGRYGSKYSTNSIWNNYGRFGSAYSTASARNSYASSPPLLVKGRKTIARLTTNKYLAGAVDPMVLGAMCYDYSPDG